MDESPARPRSVDEYIAAQPDEQRQTAQALRSAVRSADPNLRESLKWAQPVYESNGPVVAIKAFPRHVTLTFWRGAALQDRTNALEGDSDRMRHVRFASADAVDIDLVGNLVREAVALNAELGDPTRRR